MIEDYFAVIAFLICLRGLIIFPYLYVQRRTNLQNLGRTFKFNAWFGSYSKDTWKIFWLSLIWLIVYYFNYTETY